MVRIWPCLSIIEPESLARDGIENEIVVDHHRGDIDHPRTEFPVDFGIDLLLRKKSRGRGGN